MVSIDQLKQLIEVHSELIAKQAAAIARHEDAIFHLEAQGLSDPSSGIQHVAKKAPAAREDPNDQLGTSLQNG